MTSSPIIAAGMTAILGGMNWRVTVCPPWPDVQPVQHVVVALPLSGRDVRGTLGPARESFPSGHVVVWHDVHPDALGTLDLYDAWVATASDGATLDRALISSRHLPDFGLQNQLTAAGTAVAEAPDAPDAPQLDWRDWLTAREYELVCALSPDVGRKELALRMEITEDGVRYHLRSVLRKTGENSLRDLRLRTPSQIVEFAEARHALEQLALARDA